MTESPAHLTTLLRDVRSRFKRDRAERLSKQARLVGMNRETLRKILSGETANPQEKSLDMLRNYVAGPVQSTDRDVGILFAIKRMEEVLRELRKIVESGG